MFGYTDQSLRSYLPATIAILRRETSEVKRKPKGVLTSEHATKNGFGEFRLGSFSIITSIAKWLSNAELCLSLK